MRGTYPLCSGMLDLAAPARSLSESLTLLTASEGVVFSRRTLLSVLDYLVLRVPEVGLQTAIDQAVDRYYAARFSAEADRQAVQRLAEAAGLLAAGRAE